MASFDFKTIADRLKVKNVPRDLLAIDFSQPLPKGCRLRHANGNLNLLAADVLPALPQETAEGENAASAKIEIPPALMARHLAICISGRNALVKLLNLPGQITGESEAKIREDMGVSASEYHRIGYQVLGMGHGRVETKLVAVALPEKDIQKYLGFFAEDWPVPVSVEMAGLAAINAFIKGYLESSPGEAIGVIQFEDHVSFFAFFYKKELVLIRKFDFGHEYVLSTIENRLNVNRETAVNVASDQSFDITQMIKEVSDPFVRQLVISKHFVERRENCRISKIYIPGTAPASYRLTQEISVASECTVEGWDPFKAVNMAQNAASDRISLQGQFSQFAASIGAGVGFLFEAVK